MSALEIWGIVASVLIGVALIVAAIIVLVILKIRRKLLNALKKFDEEMDDPGQDPAKAQDTVLIYPTDVWDDATSEAAHDPTVNAVLRDARRLTRGNPRDRFVEPGKLDV